MCEVWVFNLILVVLTAAMFIQPFERPRSSSNHGYLRTWHIIPHFIPWVAILCKDFCDTMHGRVLSPYSHLTVHHTWVVKLSQQILHLVVFLAVFFYVSMVTRDVGAKHVLHQEGQTALLTFTVFLKDISKKSSFTLSAAAASVWGKCGSLFKPEWILSTFLGSA